MFEEFNSYVKDLVPSLGHIKKLEDQSDGPLIKVEWCGMQCSGKYGLLTKVGTSVNQGKLL